MCSRDLDCPGAQVCYVNVTWTEDAICGCSFYYGGTGLDCSVLNFQSVLLILISLSVLIIAGVALGYTFIHCVKQEFIRHSVISRDNSSATWLVAVVGLLATFIGTCFQLYSFVEPETNNVVPVTQRNGEKVGPFYIVEWVAFPIAVYCAITSALNISIMWIDAATRASKMKLYENGMIRYRNGVRVVQGCWLLIAIIGLSIAASFLLAIVGGFLCLGIAVTYVVGRKQFTDVLSQYAETVPSDLSLEQQGINKTQSQLSQEIRPTSSTMSTGGFGRAYYQSLLATIRKTSSAVVVLAMCLFIWTMSITILSLQWKNYGSINGIGTYSLLVATLYIPLSSILTVVLLYAHNALARRARNRAGMQMLLKTGSEDDKRQTSLVPSKAESTRVLSSYI